MAHQEMQHTKSRTPFERLKDASDLAYLLYRRNKNQHRRSHWWKHFSTFRRQLAQLVHEVSVCKQSASSSSDSALALHDRAEGRVDAWVAEERIDKWFAAFSQVIAEKRFAALGLTLLGLLATVCHLTGVVERLEERNVDADTALVEQLKPESRYSHERQMHHGVADIEDDVGIAVARTALEERVAGSDGPSAQSDAAPKLSKHRQKPNRIDDIFGNIN